VYVKFSGLGSLRKDLQDVSFTDTPVCFILLLSDFRQKTDYSDKKPLLTNTQILHLLP